jgi:hypothetical protein
MSRQQVVAARRAELVALAAAEREALDRQLAPILNMEDHVQRLRALAPRLPALAAGGGLVLAALTLMFPTGALGLVRRGMTLFQLARSVGRLLSHLRPKARA